METFHCRQELSTQAALDHQRLHEDEDAPSFTGSQVEEETTEPPTCLSLSSAPSLAGPRPISNSFLCSISSLSSSLRPLEQALLSADPAGSFADLSSILYL